MARDHVRLQGGPERPSGAQWASAMVSWGKPILTVCFPAVDWRWKCTPGQTAHGACAISDFVLQLPKVGRKWK